MSDSLVLFPVGDIEVAAVVENTQIVEHQKIDLHLEKIVDMAEPVSVEASAELKSEVVSSVDLVVDHFQYWIVGNQC
jgi:hypothetical protein